MENITIQPRQGFARAKSALAALLPSVFGDFNRESPPKGFEVKHKPIDPELFPSEKRRDHVSVVAQVEKARFIEEGTFVGWFYLTVKPEHISGNDFDRLENPSFKLLTKVPLREGQITIFTTSDYGKVHINEGEKAPHDKILFVARDAVMEPA